MTLRYLVRVYELDHINESEAERKGTTEAQDEQDRHEGVEGPEDLERPEKPARIDEPARLDKPERPERPARSARPDRSTRPAALHHRTRTVQTWVETILTISIKETHPRCVASAYISARTIRRGFTIYSCSQSLEAVQSYP